MEEEFCEHRLVGLSEVRTIVLRKITRLQEVPFRRGHCTAARTEFRGRRANDEEESRMDTDLSAYKLDPQQGEAL